jgi:hypothetical protein
MKENIFENKLIETVFRQAVIDNYERELDEIAKMPDIEMSARQRLRMAVLFGKKRRRDRIGALRLWTKRTAAVAASLFIVLGCALLLNPAVRASVGGALETVIKWFTESADFGPNASGGDVAAEWNPAYLPEGFSEESRFHSDELTVIRYSDGSGSAVEFQYVTADNMMSVSNENVEYGQASYDGVVYHTFAATDEDYKSAVVWDSDGWLFNVSGYLPIETLLDIARSVEQR